ncbi:periplasmic binding protein-like I [Obelidium mucronatum]|nr:periplasmic binding protein-like I [Obelidium mucronatum]
MNLILLSLLLLPACIAARSSPEKAGSSFSIAVVGPFSLFPNVTLNGSLVTGGMDSGRLIADYANENYDNDSSNLKSFFWEQLMVSFAIEDVNNDATVFPNTTIHVKRFNSFDLKNRGASGYAAQVAREIFEDHKDVIATVGAISPLFQELQSYNNIPTCGVGKSNPEFLNKQNYPYYFSTQSFSGSTRAVASLLSYWNITRIALITDTGSQELINVLQRRGIQIVYKYNAKKVSADGIEDMGNFIQYYDARYIVLDTRSDVGGLIYFTLSALKLAVGPKFVWLALKPPLPMPQGEQIFGVESSKSLKGLILLAAANEPSPYIGEMYKGLENQLNRIVSSFGVTFNETHRFYPRNGPAAYDCAQLLTRGIYKTMLRNKMSVRMLASGGAGSLFNFTAFVNTGYNGFTGNPVRLNRQTGELSATPLVFYADDNYQYKLFGVFTQPNATSVNNRSNTSTQWTSENQTNGNWSRSAMIFESVAGVKPVFFDGTTNMPDDGREVPTVFTDSIIPPYSEIGIKLQVFEGLGFALCALYLAVLIKFRTLKAVKAGSVKFTFITILGALLEYSTNELHLNYPSSTKCYLSVWFKLMGFIFIFASAIVKNRRIYLIYSGFKLTKKKASDWYNLLLLCFPVGLEIILLTGWTVFSNITIQKSERPDALVREFTCTYGYPYSQIGLIFENILTCYNALIFLATLVVTVKLQNVSGIHSEFSYLVIVTSSCIVGYILDHLLKHKTKLEIDYQFLQATIIWVLTTQAVLMQFATKATAVSYEIADQLQKRISGLQNSGIKKSKKSLIPDSPQAKHLPSLPQTSPPIETEGVSMKGKSKSLSSLNRAGKVASVSTLNGVKVPVKSGQVVLATNLHHANSMPRLFSNHLRTTEFGFDNKFHAVYKFESMFAKWNHVWVSVGKVRGTIVILLLPAEDDTDSPSRVFSEVGGKHTRTVQTIVAGSIQQYRVKLTSGNQTLVLDFIDLTQFKLFDECVDKYTK